MTDRKSVVERKHIGFMNYYLVLCSTLKFHYENVEFLSYGSNLAELFFSFKLKTPENITLTIQDIIKKTHSTALVLDYSYSDFTINEYIKFLKEVNQNFLSNSYDNFLSFGKFFFELNNQPDFCSNLLSLSNFLVYKNAQFENLSFLHFLETVHYSIIKLDFILKTHKDNYFLKVNMLLTSLFINLDMLIVELKRSYLAIDMNTIIQGIKIKPYKRFIYNRVTMVETIDSLIKHFRDAVCHIERDSKIVQNVDRGGGSTRLYIHGLNIQYGDGYIHFNQLVDFVKTITNKVIGKEQVIIAKNKENGTILCSALIDHGSTLDYPLIKELYRLERNNDFYTIFMKKVI